MIRRDYPRARGETSSGSDTPPGERGLSPRSRGNLSGSRTDLELQGTIPALAGKPCWTRPAATPKKDYPRARGETEPRVLGFRDAEGLSPRSRGNHRPVSGRGRGLGTIPALAGKPKATHLSSPCKRDYPRARGETVTASPISRSVSGLSPRSRGNRHCCQRHKVENGTIPALAGKPRASSASA